MFIDGLLNSGAIPSLERSVQFAARRQEIISHNIANLSTPNFQPMDVSVGGFQKALGEAVDRRRQQMGGRGPLRLESTREVSVTGRGLELTPQQPSGNVLFHDRNNRDLERTMQDMVENLTAFRVASDLLKGRMDLLNSAIRDTR
jgi:flagellar basal-body rod protein FlgB